jgi:TonB-linked SusC/RagA family outer membrane protein
MKKLTSSALVVVLTGAVSMGYAQKVKKDSVKTKEIGEVVVTAMGIKREKKTLGYASQEVKGDIIREGAQTGNVASQLSGKVAGLQIQGSGNFGGSTSVILRGVKSLLGNNQALFVVDGVPIDNRSLKNSYSSYDGGNMVSDMNPNDIESINVLKGAAASALYGERASAGVVVIVTKKGKSNKDGSWGITLNSEIQIGQIDQSTFTKYQDKFGAGYGFNNYAKDGFDEITINGVKTLVAPTYDDASIGAPFDPNRLVYQWDAFYPGANNMKATPWVAGKNTPVSFFETALTNSNSVTLEKSGDFGSAMLSFNNFRGTGVLPNSFQQKNTMSSKFTFKITDDLTGAAYTSLTFQDVTGRNTQGYVDNPMVTFRQWWATNVDMMQQKDAYFNSGGMNNTWNLFGYSNPKKFYVPAYHNNPYFERYQNYQNDNRTRFFGYASLNYKLNKYINFTGRVSTDFWNQKDERRVAVGSYAQNFGLSGNPQSSGYHLGLSSANETNYDLFGNYAQKFDNELSVTALLGTSLRRNIYQSLDASTEGGLIVPGLYSVNNSQKPVLAPVEYVGRAMLPRAYSQVSLGYKDTYFLEGTFAMDKSSNLPSDNNLYTYPSVSGSVILSNLIKANWLSFAKFRANYAEVGKTTGNYNIIDTYTPRGIYNGVGILQPASVKKNPNLLPEISKEMELGLEAKFFNNRLGFDISAYKGNSYNQIIQATVSAASGYTTKLMNAGEIENKGIELQLSATPIKHKDFTWDISANWSTNRNKVVALADGLDNLLLADGLIGGVTINAAVGEAYGVVKGKDYMYAPDGQRIVNNKTGRYETTTTTTNVLGNIMPDWNAGFRSSMNYKGLGFSFSIDGQKGGVVYSGDMYYGVMAGVLPETVDIRNPNFTLPGVMLNKDGVYVPNTTVISEPNRPDNSGDIIASANYAPKEYIYDASYIKLREMNISYELPKSYLEGTGLKGLKFGLVGRNLAILYKNTPYADPETFNNTRGTGGVNRTNLRGYQVGAMPLVRTIGANVTLNF